MTKTKTPTLKTKTRPRHYMANIYATFMGSVHKHSLLIFCHNNTIPNNFQKNYALAAELSSSAAQPDQLITITMQIHKQNSSSIVSPILAWCGFIISALVEKKHVLQGQMLQAHREQSAEQWSNDWVLMWGKHVCLFSSIKIFMVENTNS